MPLILVTWAALEVASSLGLDAGEDLFEGDEVADGHAFVVAGMDMDDGGTGFMCIHSLLDDLIRGGGEIRGHTGGVDRSGDRCGNNDFFRGPCHTVSSFLTDTGT